MTEKFLVTSDLNGTELLRSLALRGISTFAFRVVSAAELAETALIRCGRLPEGKRMRLSEQRFVTGALMQRAEYFARAFSFGDAGRLTDTLNSMRLRFAADEARGLREALPKGEFADKNAALLEVYELYNRWLEENGRFDDVCLIRFAAEHADGMDAEILIPAEFPLTPLEEALAARLSGGKHRAVSLQEIYGTEPSGALRLDSLTEVYGPVNEADRVIRDICDSGAPPDRCVVAVTDPAVYGQLFYDMAMEKGIPAALCCGIPVSNTRPAGLLSLWEKWNGAGFRGVDALQAMVFSDTFNYPALAEEVNRGGTGEDGPVSLRRLTELAGGMRFGPDAEANESRISAWEKTLSESSEELRLVEPLRRLGRELGVPCDRFLKKYAGIRIHPAAGALDRLALSAILDTLDLAGRYPGLVTMEDMIPMALEQTVGAEPAQPGKLAVTTIAGALSVQRDHLYILGLSADKFPGKPKENALALDSDWELLPCPETAPTSRRRVEKTLDGLTALIRLAASLGADVHAYWPDYDPAELKELIPSSAVYRLRDEFPGVKEEKEGYFPAVYNRAYAAGRLYLRDARITPEERKEETVGEAGADPEQREWSPTAIDTWYGCKRQFLYRYILHLDIPESDDPMAVISPADTGSLAHHLMEILAAERPGEAAFHDMASAMFDEFLAARPPMDPHAAEKEKERFVRMMDAARRQDPGRETVLAEEWLRSTHPCGLRLSGRPDRVEADGNGGHIVVDFKTGRRVAHVQDDPKTCRQALIYAWMLQQAGMRTAYCEYRYLRRSAGVTCGTGPAVMGQLEEDLARFYNGLKAGDFAREDGYAKECKDSDCKRCVYYGICRADKKREEARV